MPIKKLSIAIVCVLASAAWAAESEEVTYYAVFMSGEKIGHSREVRSAGPEQVVTTQETVMSMERMGAPMTVKVIQKYVETVDGKPLAFENVQDMSIMVQTVSGKIRPDGKIELTTTAAGQTQQSEMDWPAGALLVEGMLLLQKEKGLAPGTQYSFVMFEPMSLRGVEADAFVGHQKEVNILGRRMSLHEVTMKTEGITVTSYIDEDYKAYKVVTAEGGMNIEMVACSKEFALGEADVPLDVLAKTTVPSPVPLTDLATAKSVIYHLTPNEAGKITVPSLGNQKVLPDARGVSVVVSAERAPKGVAFPYAGADPRALAAIKPAPFVDSDQPEVVALARRAIGATKDSAEAARRIETFVRNYVTTKDLSVGYAKASEVVKTRRGDCTEHAVLAAAMCRAVGIPAEVLAGMLYVQQLGDQQHVFGPHAWVRVYIGEKWYNIDPTAEGGYNLGHIAFAAGDGSPVDYMRLATLMGAFKIDAVKVQPMTPPVKAPAGRISSQD